MKTEVRLREKEQSGYRLYNLKLRLRVSLEGETEAYRIQTAGRDAQHQLLNTFKTEYEGTQHGYIGCVRIERGEAYITGVYTVRGQGFETTQTVTRNLLNVRHSLKLIKGFKITALDLRDPDSYTHLYRGLHTLDYTERPYESEGKNGLTWEAPQRFGSLWLCEDENRRFCIKRFDDGPYTVFDKGVKVFESVFLQSCYSAARLCP